MHSKITHRSLGIIILTPDLISYLNKLGLARPYEPRQNLKRSRNEYPRDSNLQTWAFNWTFEVHTSHPITPLMKSQAGPDGDERSERLQVRGLPFIRCLLGVLREMESGRGTSSLWTLNPSAHMWPSLGKEITWSSPWCCLAWLHTMTSSWIHACCSDITVMQPATVFACILWCQEFLDQSAERLLQK